MFPNRFASAQVLLAEKVNISDEQVQLKAAWQSVRQTQLIGPSPPVYSSEPIMTGEFQRITTMLEVDSETYEQSNNTFRDPQIHQIRYLLVCCASFLHPVDECHSPCVFIHLLRKQKGIFSPTIARDIFPGMRIPSPIPTLI
jgi:hypothetical protein